MSAIKLPVLFAHKEECCGCAACEGICPASAIEMCLDEEGFYYPQVNPDGCLSCFLCMKVCAFKNE